MKLPRQPAAVVFDMDGLLFDTESIYERAAISAAAELGREMDSAFFRSTVGSPWTAIRERLIALYGPTFAVDELRTVAGRIFNELVEADLPLKPGVLELLDCSIRSACRGPSPRHPRARPSAATSRPTTWSIASTMSWRTRFVFFS
jgi:hypothetical protein